MGKNDMREVWDYLRPNRRLLGICAGFCAALFALLAAAGATTKDAVTAALLSAAILAVPVYMQWREYLSARWRYRAGAASPEVRAAIAEDFCVAKGFLYGGIRIGEAWIFAGHAGVLMPRAEARRFTFEKKYFRTGWRWAVCVEGDCGPTKLAELSPSECSEEALRQHVEEAGRALGDPDAGQASH